MENNPGKNKKNVPVWTWIVMGVLASTTIILFIAYINSVPLREYLACLETNKKETFKINLTYNHIKNFLEFGELYYLLKQDNGREVICLKSCGSQCTELGYSYETSSWIYLGNTQNPEDEAIDGELKESVGNEAWCSCECNK